ncbi:MAG: DUF421 domain-containing protein [Armatimonadetes bacterium]|nr:DUF421 domain-containing protein [Armatimonadota bacterium]
MPELPLEWARILLLPPDVGWLEKLARPLLVYLLLMLALRVSGKRELGQATLFDFLLILLISNVVQNAMIGADNSVVGGAVGAVMLLFLAWLLNHTTTRSPRLRRALEGSPTLLVRRGEALRDALHRENVALNDLYAGLRAAGVANLAQVKLAYLELDGRISVIPADTPEELLQGPGCVLPDGCDGV